MWLWVLPSLMHSVLHPTIASLVLTLQQLNSVSPACSPLPGDFPWFPVPSLHLDTISACDGKSPRAQDPAAATVPPLLQHRNGLGGLVASGGPCREPEIAQQFPWICCH